MKETTQTQQPPTTTTKKDRQVEAFSFLSGIGGRDRARRGVCVGKSTKQAHSSIHMGGAIIHGRNTQGWEQGKGAGAGEGAAVGVGAGKAGGTAGSFEGRLQVQPGCHNLSHTG